MISCMHRCGVSVLCTLCDSIVLHLDGLHSSLKIGVLQTIFVLFLLFDLLQLIQVPLVTLDWLTNYNIENFPPVMIGYLIKLPLWTILFLLHSLDVFICVVHVGVFLDIVLEFIEGVEDIIFHGEVNTSLMIIVPVLFDSIIHATGTNKIHRVIFYDRFYELISMLFSKLFIPEPSKINSEMNSWHLCFQRPAVCIYWWYPCGSGFFVC